MQPGTEAHITDSKVYQWIVEQAPDAVIRADREGLIRTWNRAAEKLFGHTATDTIGASLDVIIPEELRAAHWAGFNAAVETGQEKYAGRVLTTRSVHKDGRKLYVDLSFSLMSDEGGAITGVLAIGRDCTERYLAERAQRSRIAELEHDTAPKAADNPDRREHARGHADAPAAAARDAARRADAGAAQPGDDHIRKYLSEHLVHASRFSEVVDIMFQVSDGVVTLSGTVPHRGMKQSIEATAAACGGVRRVENHLAVALTAPWPDSPGPGTKAPT